MRNEIDRSTVGKRVRCVHSADTYSPVPAGTLGTISFIDDTGTVFVEWDNGSRLGLIPGTDRWEVISVKENAMDKNEKKFIDLIAASPGIAETSLPRAKRTATINALELAGLIQFGRRGDQPGGWYLTTAGEIARCEDVAEDVGGIPAESADEVA